MRFNFLVETYATERLKVASVWSEFKDEDLPVRPSPSDVRGRSVHGQMVHQCVSEDFWFMLGDDSPPDPHFTSSRTADGDASNVKTRSAQQLWSDCRYRWTHGESRTHNLCIPNLDALVQGESEGGSKSLLRGAGSKPATERPG